MSNTKYNYGNDFTFTRNEKDEYIKIKPGKDEKLQLYGPIDIVDYNGSAATITLNGQPFNSSQTLEGLSDVNVGGLRVQGEVLKYDVNEGYWYNDSVRMTDLLDTNIQTPSSSQILVYSGTKWINSTLPSWITQNQPMYLADLLDVSVDNLYSAGVLIYTANEWRSVRNFLNHCQDVMVPTSGVPEMSILTYTAGYWKPLTIPFTTSAIPTSLNDLTDVSITSPVAGNILVYTSGEFKNVDYNSILPTTYESVKFISNWQEYDIYDANDYKASLIKPYFSSVIGKHVALDTINGAPAFSSEGIFWGYSIPPQTGIYNTSLQSSGVWRDVNDKIFLYGYSSFSNSHRISYTTSPDLNYWTTILPSTGVVSGCCYIPPTSTYLINLRGCSFQSTDLISFTTFYHYMGNNRDVIYSEYYDSVFILATTGAQTNLIKYPTNLINPTTYSLSWATSYHNDSLICNEYNGVIITEMGGTTAFAEDKYFKFNNGSWDYISTSLYEPLKYKIYDPVYKVFRALTYTYSSYDKRNIVKEWISKNGEYWKTSNLKLAKDVRVEMTDYFTRFYRDNNNNYFFKNYSESIYGAMEYCLLKGTFNINNVDVGYDPYISHTTNTSVFRPLNKAYLLDDMSFTTNNNFVKFDGVNNIFTNNDPYLTDFKDVEISAATKGHYLRHNGSLWVNTYGIDYFDLTISFSTSSQIFVATGILPSGDAYIQKLQYIAPTSLIAGYTRGPQINAVQFFDAYGGMIPFCGDTKCQYSYTFSSFGLVPGSEVPVWFLSQRVFATPTNVTTAYRIEAGYDLIYPGTPYTVDITLPNLQIKNPQYMAIYWSTAPINHPTIKTLTDGTEIKIGFGENYLSVGTLNQSTALSSNTLSYTTISFGTRLPYLLSEPRYLKFDTPSSPYISTSTNFITPLKTMKISPSGLGTTMPTCTQGSQVNIRDIQVFDQSGNNILLTSTAVSYSGYWESGIANSYDGKIDTVCNYSYSSLDIYQDDIYLESSTKDIFVKSVRLNETIATHTNTYIQYNGKIMDRHYSTDGDYTLFTVAPDECTVFTCEFEGWYQILTYLSASDNGTYCIMQYNYDEKGENYNKVGPDFGFNTSNKTSAYLKKGTKLMLLFNGTNGAPLYLTYSANNLFEVRYQEFSAEASNRNDPYNSIIKIAPKNYYSSSELRNRKVAPDITNSKCEAVCIKDTEETYLLRADNGLLYYTNRPWDVEYWTTMVVSNSGNVVCTVPDREIIYLLPTTSGKPIYSSYYKSFTNSTSWTTQVNGLANNLYQYTGANYSKRFDCVIPWGFNVGSSYLGQFNLNSSFSRITVITSVFLPVNNRITAFAEKFDDNTVLFVASSYILYNNNMTNTGGWTTAQFINATTSYSIVDALYIDKLDKYVAVSVNTNLNFPSIFTSTGGIVWTSVNLSNSIQCTALHWNPFLEELSLPIYGTTRTLLTKDLITFTTRTFNNYSGGPKSYYDYINDIQINNDSTQPTITYTPDTTKINIGDRIKAEVDIQGKNITIGKGSNTLTLGDDYTQSIKIGDQVFGKPYFLQSVLWSNLAAATLAGNVRAYMHLAFTTNFQFSGIPPLPTTDLTVAMDWGGGMLSWASSGATYGVFVAPVDGLYLWSNTGILFSVSGGNLYFTYATSNGTTAQKVPTVSPTLNDNIYSDSHLLYLKKNDWAFCDIAGSSRQASTRSYFSICKVG